MWQFSGDMDEVLMGRLGCPHTCVMKPLDVWDGASMEREGPWVVGSQLPLVRGL